MAVRLLQRAAIPLPNHFVRPAPINNRRLFITTTTVLPSWPTTPMVSGILASIAKLTSTITVPSEMMRFCRMMRRARWLSRHDGTDPRAEMGKGEAPEYSDSKGTAELADKVIDSGAHSRLVRRERRHDRSGRRRHREADAYPNKGETDLEYPSRRCDPRPSEDE